MWSPNPLAIAQLLLGDNAPASSLQDMLQAAFALKAELIFDGDGSQPPRFQLFQQLADAFSTPQNLATVLAHPLVRKALAKHYSPAQIERVLPFLVPIADAVFTPPGAAPTTHGMAIAGEYRDIGALTLEGASFMDPVQGAVADCYLISAMIALAWTRPEAWDQAVRALKIATASGPRFRFRFHSGTTTRDPPFDAGPLVPMKADKENEMLVDRNNRPKPYYASSSRQGEAWPSIIEKGYVMQTCHLAPRDPSAADYQLIGDHGREPQMACRMLVGGSSHCRPNDISHLTPPLSHAVRANCDPRGDGSSATIHPTMAWTWNTVTFMRPLGWSSTGLFANHAYAVLGWMRRHDKDYVVLRNPHGNNVTRPHGYASGEWKPRAGDRVVRRVELNEGGVFAILAEWFDKCFDKVGWVEL